MNQRDLRAQLVLRFPRERQYLLPALHYVQHELGHLPEFAQQVVGWHLHIPASEVYGAATSYSELRIDETGTHVVRVCTGLPCRLNGADELIETARRELGVAPGETTSDGSTTLEETPCSFVCSVAPVMEIDGRLRGRLTVEHARGLLRETQQSINGVSL